MNEIQFTECDENLRSRVGETMGEVAERHVCLENGFTFLALDDGRPVGLLAIRRRQLPEPVPETYDGFVNIIKVAAPYRRRGIAKRLVEMTIDRCRQLGLYQVRGWSSVDKLEAIPMWRALGFTLCPGIEVHGDQEIKGYLFAHKL